MSKSSIIRLITATIALTLSMTSCTSSDGGALPGYKEISNEGVSYDLYVPDEWVVDEQTAYTSAHRSITDPSNISVMALELTSSNNFEAYEDYWKNSCEPSLKAIFPDLEYEAECRNFILDGIQSAEYIYTGTTSHGNGEDGSPIKVKYKFQQIIAKKNGTVYTLTFTANEQLYDEAAEEVAAIWSNFRFH